MFLQWIFRLSCLQVNTIADLDGFKVHLAKFLEAIPDTPPTTGYTAANGNSILNWFNQPGGLREKVWPCRFLPNLSTSRHSSSYETAAGQRLSLVFCMLERSLQVEAQLEVQGTARLMIDNGIALLCFTLDLYYTYLFFYPFVWMNLLPLGISSVFFGPCFQICFFPSCLLLLNISGFVYVCSFVHIYI